MPRPATPPPPAAPPPPRASTSPPPAAPPPRASTSPPPAALPPPRASTSRPPAALPPAAPPPRAPATAWLRLPRLAHVVALVVPPVCAACRAPLPSADGVVCAACRRALRWLGPLVCRRCALPAHGGRPCPAAAAPFATAWAPLAYAGPARDLVRALKFRGALPLAGVMAAQVTTNAPPWALGGAPVCGRASPDLAVVPVPAAPARRRARGFDPAAVLAREVAARLGLEVADCLRRIGSSPRQLGARRTERRATGRFAVEVVRPPPSVALLFDDVHTTGSTLAACALALRRSDTRRVHAITYVRTL